MATETLPSGNYVADIRRAEGRWRLSLGTDKAREAKQRKATLMALADTEEGRSILDRLKSRELKIEAVVAALAPGGRGVGALRPKFRGVTLGEACASYLAGTNVRASSKREIERVARQLMTAFGAKTRVHEVTRTQAREWLKERGWAPNTQLKARTYAQAIFDEALKLEGEHARAAGAAPKLIENVWNEVTPETRGERVIAFLTRAEVAQFLAQLDTRERAFMACGFLGGLRIGETCNLRWQDVDLEARTLKVQTRGGAYRWTPKSGKSRTVTMTTALVEALAEWRGETRGEYVFGVRENAPLSEDTGGVWAKRAFEKAGMVAGRARGGWTYHAGRHSAASNALRRGIAASVVAEWLGDKVETLLNTYSHVLKEDLTQVAKALEV